MSQRQLESRDTFRHPFWKWKTLSHVLTLQPHGLYSSQNSPGQNTGVGSVSLLQGVFPTQELNPGPPQCRQIPYQLSLEGSPRILEWVAYPFSRGYSKPRNRTRVSCITGRFFTNWAIRGALIHSEVVKFANKYLSELPPTRMWLRRSRWYCHFPVAKKKDRAVIAQDYLLSLFVSLAKSCLGIFQIFVKPDYSVNYGVSEDLPAIVHVLKPLEKRSWVLRMKPVLLAWSLLNKPRDQSKADPKAPQQECTLLGNER